MDLVTQLVENYKNGIKVYNYCCQYTYLYLYLYFIYHCNSDLPCAYSHLQSGYITP